MQASWIGWGMLLVAIGACGDSTPGERITSPPPPPKIVTRTDPASMAQCPYGGSVVSSGLDDNGNGTLDDAEIRNRTVICNPAPEAPPPPVLVRLRPEPKGAHCAVDGTAVDSGPDTNGNGTLDDSEVAHTDYVCGQALVTRFDTEPAGPHCFAGGLAFSIGLDRNGDGVLNNDEVLQVEYECSEILSRGVVIRSDADVAALAKIRVINGFLAVEASSLTDVTLPQLTRVTGGVFIEDNPQLTRVSLPGLQGVDDVVALTNDPALTTVNVPALQHVKQLKIIAIAIPDLGGFPALQSADTGILLGDNPALQGVRLPSLSSIGGQLEVTGSPALTALSLAAKGQLDTVVVFDDGLQTLNLTLDSAGVLAIGANPQLTTASVAVQQLGTIGIGGNASLTHLALHTENSIDGDVSITGNDSLRSFEYFDLFTIHGSLTLSGPFDDTLGEDGFDIDGDFTLQQTELTRVSVFRVAGMLHLMDNPGLTGPISARTLGGLELTGSPAMEVLTLDTPQIELPHSVVVGGNDALREVDLGSITSIRETLALLNSPALVATPSSVTSIGANLFLQNDPALVDLGFDRLQHVGFLLDIEGMASLQAIGLPALTQVQNIEVFGNGALRHLGLPTLLGPTTIFVSWNPHLPACEVDALFARVPGTHEQTGNDETAMCTGAP
jgi:hypothetical protein